MSTFIIGTIVIGSLILGVVKIAKDKKKGGCGCGCSGCSHASDCHKQS